MGYLLEKNKPAQFSFIRMPSFGLFGQPPLPVTREGAVSIVLCCVSNILLQFSSVFHAVTGLSCIQTLYVSIARMILK